MATHRAELRWLAQGAAQMTELAYLSDNTIGMSGAASPMGETALCSKPVRLLDTSSGHSRMLKALAPSAPPTALCAWYRWRFSFSACRRATYCSHELMCNSNLKHSA